MKKLLTMVGALLLLSTMNAQAQQKKFSVYAVGFYNLENLFDTCHDAGKNDYEYLPDGKNKWSGMKYRHKLRNMSRVLSEMGTDMLPTVGCAAIGVSEVENANCLRDLCEQEPLKKRNFQFCHIEGPDRRGVDCGLLYNPSLFTVRDVKLVPYVYRLPKDSTRATRGFLVVSGTLANEHVTIIVNHLPSRFSESFYREEGGRQIRQVKDSLLRDDPNQGIIFMGDLNDDPQNKSCSDALGAKKEMKDCVEPGSCYNPWWNILGRGIGTLGYRGNWNLFDQIIFTDYFLKYYDSKDKPTLTFSRAEVLNRKFLRGSEGDRQGYPLRTFTSGIFLNGYSDHFPTMIYLVKEIK